MNMLKRSLAMLLVLCMLFSAVPFSVFAEDTTEPSAVTEVTEQQPDGPGNSEFGHAQGKGKDKKTEATEPVTEATEETVPETSEETVPETTEETVPETSEETVPETTEETVPETTEETVPETSEETVPETTEESVKISDNKNDAMLADVEAAAVDNVASTEGVYTDTVEAPEEFLKVFHLDVGRKYFTVDQVTDILDLLGEKGYSHMELAIGNDGLRFLLDDMSVTVGDTTYDSATVTAGVKAGNAAYSHAGEWSEDEMHEIFTYAKTKGIEIIPLLNTPGHMDAILDAMEACGISGSYNGSARTVDVTNATAVAFTQALVGKYMDYFASKGCTYFNIGADEYANDIYNSGSMGFGQLVNEYQYDEFIDYVNQLVAMAVDTYGLRPIAFNDGIYFNSNTNFGTFDTRLIVSYWSGGWGGYPLASTSFLQGKNHLILNTSDLMYYVMGRVSSGGYNYNDALSRAGSYDVDDTVSGAIGAMQCVWCDEPEAEYNADEQARVQNLITTLANTNNTVYTGPNVVVPAPEPEVPEDVGQTVTDADVAVTAPGLTDLTVQQITENIPTVENAKAVVAYSVAPVTAEGAYTGEATVTLPVPADWTNVRGGVLESAAGEAVMGIEGELLTAEDGTKTFTFIAPHFSTVVAYEVETAAEGDPTDTIVDGGGTAASYVLDKDGLDVNAQYLIVSGTNALKNDRSSLTVTVSGENATPNADATDALWEYTSWSSYGQTLYGLSNNGNYLYPTRNYDDGWNYYLSISTTQNSVNVALNNNQYSVANYYKTSYLAYKENSWTAQEGAAYLSFYKYTPGTQIFTVNAALQESRITSLTVENAGYTEETWTAYQSALTTAQSKLTQVKGASYNSETEANTALNELIAAVEALQTAKSALAKAVAITINYVDENGTTVMTEIKNVAETAESIILTSPIYDTASNCYVFEDTTLELTAGTTEYTVNVTYQAEDLTKVPNLEIEYWITNHPVTPDGQTANVSYVDHDGETQTNEQRIWIDVAAVDNGIYSESGVPLTSLAAATGTDSHMGSVVVYWKGVMLNTNEYQQTTDANDNESFNGAEFTHVRYWNKTWEVLTSTGWTAVAETNQLVAYYLQKTTVTNLDVIQTEVVDWGEVHGSSSYDDSNFVVMDFALQYENGTRNPASFPVSQKTLKFHCDYGTALNATVFEDDDGYYYRRIGTIKATETSNYEVYMITVTPNHDNRATNDSDYIAGSSANTLDNPLNYAGTEKVIWVDDVANLGEFENTELQHADFTVGGEPVIQKLDVYNKHAVLVTYYVRAKVTPDALTVHYIDEAAGNVQFYEYNIAVNKGTYFNEQIALPNPWKGYLVNGTVQTIDPSVTQTVSSDLGTLPAVAAQYLYSDYKCVRIELKKTTITNEDGTTTDVPKDLYLYYTFNPTVTLVADFGLPIEIKATDLNSTLANNVKDMSYTGGSYTAYGQLIDNGTTITYKPNKIMQGSDFFTILVTTNTAAGVLDDTSTQVAFRVYVVPATTVHYEADFIEWGNWDVSGSAHSVGTQATEQLSTDKLFTKKNVYGYDPVYGENTSNSPGASATTSTNLAAGTFTFTGDGIQVFANSTTETSYVSVEVKNSNNNTVNLSFVNTVASNGTTGATDNQATTLNGLPIVSLVDLQNMDHDTYTVTIKKIRDTSNEKPVIIDGIRVFNTLADSSVYKNDLEDDPSFIELRDTVLHAIGVRDLIDNVTANGYYGYIGEDGIEYVYLYDSDGKLLKNEDGTVRKIIEVKNDDGTLTFVDAVTNAEVEGTPTTIGNQVYNDVFGATALIIDEGVNYGNSNTVQDLLDNGPKNEIYLFSGQTLKFKVKTNRVIQVGLKAPNGATVADINGTDTNIQSSVDMFYTLAGKDTDESRVVSVEIKNDGNNILSVTLLKICDDPNYSFVAFSEDDVKAILNKIPLNPENPGTPEKPTGPEKPNEPVKPNKPIKLEKPLKKSADAKLKISLVDKNGKVLATTKLKAMGMEGDTAKFDAKTILKTAKAKLPSKYKILDEDSVSSVNVEYGAEKTIKIQIGKVATLKVTYINLKGKKVGTATLTKVQTSGSSYTFSASAIRKAAPKGYSSAKISSVKVSYGKTKTLKVTVF